MGDTGPNSKNQPATGASPAKPDPSKPVPVSYTIPPQDAGAYNDGAVAAIPAPDLKSVGRQGPGDAPVRVNTDALKTYSANLRVLSRTLTSARAKLDEVNNVYPISPGWFPEAVALKDRVNAPPKDGAGGTTGGVIGVTSVFMTKLITALNDTADGLDQLAAKYVSVDQLNGATAKSLNDLIATAELSITKATGVTGTPKPVSTT
jgi:hypothetical protein